MGRSWRVWILEGSGLHALGSKHCTIEGNLRLPDLALCTVEDNAMFCSGLQEAQEVMVMLLRGMAKDAYIIMNGNNAG